MKFFKMCLFITLFIGSGAFAADIALYYSPSCPHCHHARDFIENNLIYEYDSLSVNEINVMNANNREDFFATIKKCEYETGGVPVMVIGKKCFQGYADSMQDEIRKAVEQDLSEEQKKQASMNKSELEKNRDQFVASHQSRKQAIVDSDSKKKINNSTHSWFYILLAMCALVSVIVLKHKTK